MNHRPQVRQRQMLVVVICLLVQLWFLPQQVTAKLVLCVCAEEFESAWQPWIKYRNQQGYVVKILRPKGSAAGIRESLKRLQQSHEIAAIVLVGDAPSFFKGKFGERTDWHIPTFYSQAKVNVLFGSEPEVASDLPYGDLNGDGIIDVPVGRIPVVDAQQLAGYVKRVQEYEKEYSSASDKRDIHFVAGVGGFGPALDGVLTSVTRKFISQGIPGSFRVTMTQASWQSPFCPDPFAFGKHTINRLNQGGLFWVYMGHGLRDQLDRVVVPGEQPVSILRRQNLEGVDVQGMPPVCVFLACYVGAFDSNDPCIGEQLMLLERGPIAVYAASRVSMPYAMSVMGDGMLRQSFRLREELLGNVITNAKRSLVVPAQADRTANRMLLDNLAGTLSPAPHLLKEERAEHALMFNLLGDPLLRLNYPRGVKLTSPVTARNGSDIQVGFQAPVAGKAILELAAERGVQRFVPMQRQEFDRTLVAKYTDEYIQANDAVWHSEERAVNAAEAVSVKMKVENISPGFQTIRLYLQGDQHVYIGSKRIYVSN